MIDKIKDENWTISVIVWTYNSERYLNETLESVKAQTYQNIELIVTDDCSSDETVNLCKAWMEENNNRFLRTQLVTSNWNTGIAANGNRGLRAAAGDWVKTIAGDDILLPGCVSENVSFALSNPDAKFIFSKYRYLINGKISPKYYFRKSFFQLDCSQQYDCLLEEVGVNCATIFMSRSDLLDLGGYNEEFPFLEDAPLWLKASSKGYKLFAFSSFTVIYRIHSGNSCLSNEGVFINKNFYASKKKFYTAILRKELKRKKKYLTLFSSFIDYWVKDTVISKGNRRSDYNFILKLVNLLNINRLIGLNGYFNKHKDYDF